jgi:hypothetical protein
MLRRHGAIAVATLRMSWFVSSSTSKVTTASTRPIAKMIRCAVAHRGHLMGDVEHGVITAQSRQSWLLEGFVVTSGANVPGLNEHGRPFVDSGVQARDPPDRL